MQIALVLGILLRTLGKAGNYRATKSHQPNNHQYQGVAALPGHFSVA
jgi:hypothetical protein